MNILADCWKGFWKSSLGLSLGPVTHFRSFHHYSTKMIKAGSTLKELIVFINVKTDNLLPHDNCYNRFLLIFSMASVCFLKSETVSYL